MHTSVTVDPHGMCNNVEIETVMVPQGVGITRVPLFTRKLEVARGDLQNV